MRQIRNKTALITGAASGIGRALALRLAREGADLYLLDCIEAGLCEIVNETRQMGVEVLGRYCDVRQVSQIKNSCQHLLDCWGGLDILVNNAGITYYGQTDQMTAEHCDRLLTINLHAPIHFTRELLPSLLARPESHVLNIASFFGLVGTRKTALYTSSKFGMVGFSESLRAEYGRRGLGVTALCPGFVDTGLFSAAPLGKDQQQPKHPPRWMLTTPEKIADNAIQSIYGNRALAIPQLYAKFVYYGKSFLPGLYDWANHLSRKQRHPAQPLKPVETPKNRRAA